MHTRFFGHDFCGHLGKICSCQHHPPQKQSIRFGQILANTLGRFTPNSDVLPLFERTIELDKLTCWFRVVGLSEVVGGLGLEKLKELMPDIINTAERTNIHPHVRDGYIMMYIYLPSVFPEEFLDYVGPIIPSVLKVKSSVLGWSHPHALSIF